MDSEPVKILVPQKELPHEYLHKLHSQMLDILNDDSYPADIKNKLYQQVLHIYNVTRDKMQQPLEMEVKNFPVTQNDSVPAVGNELEARTDIFKTIPKTIKNNAQGLFEQIQKSKRVKINEKGELLIDDNLLRGSNIVDLIHDFTRKRKGRPPAGYRELAQVLKSENVPREYISNPYRWDLISSSPQYFTNKDPVSYDSSSLSIETTRATPQSKSSDRTVSTQPLRRLPGYRTAKRVAKDSTTPQWKKY